jgi:DNA-binding CsgD family transcriptional regulator
MKRNPDAAQVKETQAQREMIEVAYGTELPYSASYRLAFMSRMYPRGGQALWEAMDKMVRRRWSADVVLDYTVTVWDEDVSDEATRIGCPTLVLHTDKGLFVPCEEGRRLAALIPGARFVTLDSENHLPLEDEASWPVMREEMRAFLGMAAATGAPPPRPAAHVAVLTKRQIEVLRAVSEGRTDKEIARELGLSPRTVEMHVARILAALECPSRSAAVRAALERRLLG